MAGRVLLYRAAVIMAAACAGATGCGSAPPRLLADTPAGNPLSPRACGDTRTVPALGATQLQRAYQAPAMFAHGITGAGTTIAVILPYANPWLASDLATYSRRYALPAPQVQVINWHHAPAARLDNADQAGWAQEGTLDVEMAHVLAPAAHLIYLEIPTRSSLYMTALTWLITHQHVTVVSMSEGVPEAAMPGGRLPAGWRDGVLAAARAGVTVVADTGDNGATQPIPDQNKLFPSRSVLWPASDPLVTAIGGTRLHLDAAGNRTGPDTTFANVKGWAGGGGLSQIFTRPPWQDRVAAVTGSRRGVADVAMDASSCSPVAAYATPNGVPGQHSGWAQIFGTSVAAPLFAAIVADAAQLAGRRLGVLNPALYRLHGPADGVLDVTQGTTSTPAMAGYRARRGYDLPTGVGTVEDAWRFASALARPATGSRTQLASMGTAR